MNKGYISLHRQIMDNPMYYAEPFTRMAAWIDLLLLANHKQGFIYVRGNRVTVNRGQVGMSETSFAERWQWSRGKVRRFLKELEKDNQIVQQKSRIKSLLSIVNYDKYQTDGTTDRTTDGQQTDTNNKNNKNDNIKGDFENFWTQYHQITGKPKTDKESALKYWNKLTAKEQTKAIEAIKPYYNSLNDPKFTKKARTYLSEKNFNDEFKPTKPQRNSSLYIKI